MTCFLVVSVMEGMRHPIKWAFFKNFQQYLCRVLHFTVVKSFSYSAFILLLLKDYILLTGTCYIHYTKHQILNSTKCYTIDKQEPWLIYLLKSYAYKEVQGDLMWRFQKCIHCERIKFLKKQNIFLTLFLGLHLHFINQCDGNNIILNQYRWSTVSS